MNLRIFSLVILLSSSSFVRAEHYHHHLSAHDLINIIEKKDSEIFWAKVKTAGIAGIAGFVAGWLVAKS